MHRRSRSSLLLAELVISIFFFLAAAAVSVRIFAAAREKSDEAVKNQNLAALPAFRLSIPVLRCRGRREPYPSPIALQQMQGAAPPSLSPFRRP